MLSPYIIDQLQPYDFDRLAHKEKDGRRRLRLIALAHLKDGKRFTEVGGRVRGEEIRQLLARQFGVAYSLNGVYDLMKRLGLVWISARAVSPYADPVAQTEFKKKLRHQSSGSAAAGH